MSALVSFITGSAFRMIWGEVAAFVSKKQDHKYELHRIQQQAQIEAAQHSRNIESMRLQSDLGIKEVIVKAEADITAIEVDAWRSTSEATSKITGIGWVDAWNQSIRPLIASAAILSLVAEAIVIGGLTEFHREIFAAAIGLFIADRSLGKRGK